MRQFIKVNTILSILVLAALAISGCSTIFPPPTPTPTETPTETPTPLPTDTPLPTETPTPLPTNTPLPTLPPLPTATVASPTPTGKPIYIYFIQKDSGGNVACGDSLVSYTSGRFRTNDVALDVKVALLNLFAYHTAEMGGTYNPLYKSSLKVSSVSWNDNDRITVDLAGDIKLTDDSCDPSRIMAMLQATVRQFPGIASVELNLNGSGIKNYLK